MKNLLIYILCTLSVTASGQSINDLFRSMPSELLPGVSEGNKTMLLVDTGNTSVPYALGKIRKIRHSNDFLQIRTSAAGDTQLKMLPLMQDSLIICLIQTVCADGCDSHLSFFTTQWQQLDPNRFLPDLSAKFSFNSFPKNSENDKYAVSLPDFYPISARFSTESTDLMLKLHYSERMTGEEREKIKPFLESDSILLKWENGFFR
ncbi:MAG: DUF3256 family protein [Proteiniphilum sp.]|nr:DUF3256 family protein [Proteiniphilum sp.]MDD4158206.1 DUF3256 family protein [Proteiniphilum sp.]MDD4799820.1 DUF3256 family protein [Proteiniphilum sp.]